MYYYVIHGGASAPGVTDRYVPLKTIPSPPRTVQVDVIWEFQNFVLSFAWGHIGLELPHLHLSKSYTDFV